MTPHVLDQPIRNALLTRHRHLSEGNSLALRYQPDIAVFAAAADDSLESLAALAALIPANGITIQLQNGEYPDSPGIAVETVFDAVQMVAKTVTAPGRAVDFLELSGADVPDMVELATLTKPGPFLARTHAFGGYIGIRVEGRLAAMAGYRLKVPGFTEISAVCTHPGFRGRGYASSLTQVLAGRIKADGDTPFLHTYATNTSAIRLYEHLGFEHRSSLNGRVLRRA